MTDIPVAAKCKDVRLDSMGISVGKVGKRKMWQTGSQMETNRNGRNLAVTILVHEYVQKI